MGLQAVRVVLLLFMCIFLCGLYQTTLKLPLDRESGAAEALLYRSQAFQSLKRRLSEEVVNKEREVRNFIDSTVDVMVPHHLEPKAFRASHGRDAVPRGEDKSTMAALRRKGHPILAASDEQFLSTPLSEFWRHYGPSKGAANCEADFGYGLLKAWRDTNETYCAPHGPGDSRIQCHLMHQNHHHGGGDNLCVASDVRLSFRELTDQAGVTKQTMKRYIESRHSDAAWVHFAKGFMSATCEPRPKQWVASAFPGWNEDLLYKGLRTLPGKGSSDLSSALECDEWVEHPVLVVQRDTFANFFHDSEDFVNAFLAMAVLGWNLKDTQIYLLDLYPKGPFWDMWSRVFNGGRPPKMAWDLKEDFGKSRVCFKQLAVGIYGPAAPTTLASFKSECEHATLVRAYSDMVIRGLGLQGLTHYAQPAPSKTVTITWMARRASVIWPERAFCGDDSFFKCDDFAHLETRRLGRMVVNDAQVVAALKGLESRTFRNGAKVRFQDKDYNLLSFEEQIRVDLETDIMVGPHGAGLMHNVFMRDRAALVEVFIDGSGANKHFHNLARWYGRDYYELPSDNPVSIGPLVQLLANIVEKMDLSKW